MQAVDAEDVLSINSRDQQAQVDAIMQERIQREILQSGVTIVSAINTYIEAGVTIGADTIIRPFTHIGRHPLFSERRRPESGSCSRMRCTRFSP